MYTYLIADGGASSREIKQKIRVGNTCPLCTTVEFKLAVFTIPA